MRKLGIAMVGLLLAGCLVALLVWGVMSINTSIDNDHRKAYEHGYSCGVYGMPYTANPYPDAEKQSYWFRGWAEAKAAK